LADDRLHQHRGEGGTGVAGAECNKLDGTEAFVDGSTVSDPVALVFGTRVDFGGGNSFTGGVSCDATVLVRGDVACPPAPASLQAQAAGRSVAPLAAGPEVEGLGPFALEP
jgi:hypothetical protein